MIGRHVGLPTVSPPIRHQRVVRGLELFIRLNGCHSAARFCHLSPSASSNLSRLLIIRLIWRPSASLIRTFPESHLLLAVGMSTFMLLVNMFVPNEWCLLFLKLIFLSWYLWKILFWIFGIYLTSLVSCLVSSSGDWAQPSSLFDLPSFSNINLKDRFITCDTRYQV